jgi:hypothetical protein
MDTLTAERLLSEIYLRLLARESSGATEDELTHFLKVVSGVTPTIKQLRAAIDLLLATDQLETTTAKRHAAVYYLKGKKW